ncbi:MAG: molecular chaperone TorD family protein [Planctomycetes bacterium]|nr:molecular chaperone TorD family protein [Planctomycetota bacterium]
MSALAEVREALVHAADLRLIGLLFERPSESRRRHVAALASECADPSLRATADLVRDVDGASYDSVFAAGGPVSPREAAYLGRSDPARAMSQVKDLYEAFAYRPPEGEPVDHVAVETGFAAYLWLKEAYARAQGNAEAAEVTAAARNTFLQEHLAALAHGLAKRSEGAPAAGLVALVQALIARVGPAPTVEAGLDESEVDEDLSCGNCGQS